MSGSNFPYQAARKVGRWGRMTWLRMRLAFLSEALWGRPPCLGGRGGCGERLFSKNLLLRPFPRDPAASTGVVHMTRGVGRLLCVRRFARPRQFRHNDLYPFPRSKAGARFLLPESVAVIGVSPSPTNLGRAIAYHLFEFRYTGRVYLVGPKGAPFSATRSIGRFPRFPERWNWLSFLPRLKRSPTSSGLAVSRGYASRD